jgi:transcriptional regulator with XRE-family HTH domain
MKISEKIKKFRRLKGLSQQQVADKLNMSKNGYGSIERGETGLNNLKRLQKLAEIFGVDISAFFDSTEHAIINLAETQDQSNWHIGHSSNELRHELEKCHLLLEQKDQENALLKQQNVDLRSQNADLRAMIEFLRKEKPS